MSNTIDQRVVEMQFDNRNFEKNVSTTMSTLDKLKQSLKFSGASKGFEDIGSAARGVNLSGISSAVETVQAKFSALSVIGVTALANITNSAINTGKQLVKSLSIDQIKEGWDKFGSKTTSVATLVAQGNDLKVVNDQLDRLNWFTDETSYNFTDMVSNIAKFTASGKGLEESVTAMEGIATWAALSGQNARTASNAMYQLSQAMGAGVMRREDYRSIQNASMDTKEFREKCIDAAIALGTLKDNGDGTYISMAAGAKKTGFTVSQFADSLTEGMWLTSDVMMKVFNDYSNAVSKIYEVTEEKGLLASEVIDEIHETSEKENITIDQAIKKLGYVDKAGNLLFDSFGLKAFEAAQKARTWGDAIDSVKDAVSTGWMNTFEIIFGNSEEATQLWTDLANAMWDVFAAGGEARNEMLKGWKELGGRDDLIEGFWNVWEGFFGDGDEYLGILGSIKEAFRDIFPPMTAERLAELTTGFKNFTERIKPSAETLDKLKRAFKGVFSIIGIGKKAITTILKPIGQLLGSEGFGSIGDFLLSTAADIGDFFTALNEGFETNKVSEVLSGIVTKISSFIKGIFDGLGGFSGMFSSVGKTICGVAEKIWNAVTKVFGWIRENISASDVFAGLAGGGIFVAAKKLSSLINKVKDIFENLFDKKKNEEGLKSKFSEMLDSANEALQSFTSGIKVTSLLGIAAAVTLLSSAFSKISELDGQGIAKSLLAIGSGLGMMVAALNLMPKSNSLINSSTSKSRGFLSSFTSGKIFSASTSTDVMESGISMMFMAEALKILADAMTAISKLSLKDIGAGLIGIAGDMAILCYGLKAVNGTIVPVRTSLAMMVLAKSCKTLAEAFISFTEFSWDEIARGLVAMGGALGELTAVMVVLGKYGGFSDIFASTGILITVKSLGDLATHLKSFGEMGWDEIARGLVAMGGALAEIGGVLFTLSEVSKISFDAGEFGGLLEKIIGKGKFSFEFTDLSLLFSSGAVWIVVDGLGKLAESLKSLGEMSWSEIARGLTAMGGALTEIGIVLAGLSKVTASASLVTTTSSFVSKLSKFANLFSAGAIWIVIQGLSKLSDSLSKLGNMGWGQVARSLISMGIALAEIGGVVGILGRFVGFKSILGATAVWIVIQGLNDLAEAFNKIGSMTWDEVERGLIGMGGALAEVTLMSGALGSFAGFAAILGGAAIWVAVQGLDDLANSLKKFGSMDWDTINKGLVAMSHALGVIALGGFINTLSIIGSFSISAMAKPLGDLADSLKKWGTVAVPEGLGLKLGSLANGIMLFTYGGLGALSIAAVAKPLGDLADSVKKWSGVNIPDGLNSKLSSLAAGVRSFTFDGLGALAISAVGQPLGDLADSVSKWSDTDVPDNLGQNLSSLASGVRAFSFAFLGGWSIDAIAEPLKTLAGSVRAWRNISIPDSLSTDLSTLATGVKAFSFAFLGGWSISAIVNPLKNLADSVTAWNGVSIPDGIGSGLSSLAGGIEAFSFAFVGGYVLDDIVTPLKDLAGSMKAWGNVTVPSGMEGDLSSLAAGVRAFTFDGLGASAISEVASPLGTLADSIRNWADISVPKGLIEDLKELSKGVWSFTFDGFGASSIGEVAEPLGVLADSVSKWSSLTIPAEFGKKLGELADGVGKFTLTGLGASAIKDVASPLGDLADSIQKWTGITIPEGFGSSLESLAKGVKAFKLDGADGIILTDAASGLDVLADSISKWKDVTIPTGLSGQLESLSTGILSFYVDELGDNALIDSAAPLGVLADSVKQWSKVTVPEGLSGQLESLATGIKAFTGEDLGDNVLISSAAPLGTLADSVSKWTGVIVPENLSEQLTSLATGVKAFCGEEFETNILGEVADPVGTLADSIAKWAKVTVPANLSADLTSLATGVKAFTSDAEGVNLLESTVGPIGTLADSIAKWSKVTIPEGLSAQLESLATGVKAFTFEGSADGANALVTAAPGVGTMADSIKKWSGVTVPEGLSAQLESLATGVKAFTFETEGTNMLSEAATGVGSMADSIAKWSGVTIPEGLPSQLEALSTGVMAFNTEGGANLLNESSIGVGNMADSIAKWSGVTIPEGLPAQLAVLAGGIMAFNTDGGSNMLGEAATGIGSMADAIKKWTKVTIPDDLSGKLKNLAAGVKEFDGTSQVLSGVSALEKINTVCKTLATVSFSTITSGLEKLGASLVNFGADASSVTGVGESINSNIIAPIRSALPSLIALGGEISSSISSGIRSNSLLITGASTTVANSAIRALNSKKALFRTAGSQFGSYIATGMSNRSSTVYSAGSSLASSAVSGARSGYSGLYSAGSYLCDGLAKGIRDNTYKATQAAKDMADEINRIVPIKFLEQSPSRLFMKFGRYLPEGLAIGIEDSTGVAVKSASNMAVSTIDGFKKGISNLKNAITTGIDAQPTIRPILDLSDVESGVKSIGNIFGGAPSVGVMATLSSISSDMNRRSQNRSNDDIISAINKLGDGLANNRGDTYNFGDFTYDDGSNVADAVGELIRYAKIGRRV